MINSKLKPKAVDDIFESVDKTCAAEWKAFCDTLKGEDIPAETHALINAAVKAAFELGFATAKDPSWLIWEK